MKLSKQQAGLLASEVLKALKRNGVAHVSESTIAKLRQWKEKRDELIKAEKEADEATRKHDASLQAITGKNKNIRSYNSVSEIVDKMKEGNTPSLQEIEDKIVLRAMFTNEDDLQSFVQSIVKDFTKKKPVAAN
jgi:hypothetical protein